MNAPRRFASGSRLAAGCTSADVPMVRTTSDADAALAAASKQVWSSASPNQVTAGRTMPPQCGQRGGIVVSGTMSSRQSSRPAAQRCQQRTCQMDPCRRITRSAPDRSSRPSTFWVISVNSGYFVQAASTSWARFGLAFAISPRRQSYHFQTSAGSSSNASGVASDSARYCFQRPSAPRKVGMPDAAEMPAPVTAATRFADWRRETTASIESIRVDWFLARSCESTSGRPGTALVS